MCTFHIYPLRVATCGVEVAILTIFQTIYLKISTEVDNDDLITMVIRAAWYAIQWEVKAFQPE